MTVVALCAAWCDVCNGFEPLFWRLAREFPGAEFVWIDIEDRADIAGDIDVGDFPTIAVYRGGRPVHFGVALPQEAPLRRLLRALAAEDRAAVSVAEAVAVLPQRIAKR